MRKVFYEDGGIGYEPDKAPHKRKRKRVNGTERLPVALSAAGGAFRIDTLLDEEEELEPDLVPKIVPGSGVVFLIAPPKTGKTIWAGNVACAMTTKAKGGGEFLGHRIRSGRVLYITLDFSRKKIFKLFRTMDPNNSTRDLYCVTRKELPRTPEDRLKWLRKWCHKHRPALVIIDTFGLFRCAPHSNALYYDDYHAIAQLQQVAERYAALILLLHHTNRRGWGRGASGATSGTNALGGGVDGTLKLRRNHKSKRGTLTVEGWTISDDKIALNFDGVAAQWTLGEFRGGRPAKELERAKHFLQEELKDGDVEVNELKQQAPVSWRTVNSAKAKLGIENYRKGTQTFWGLSEEGDRKA